ncbi:MAG: hypothetical protein WC718_04290 [Phycisphaerales bacterium]|jgi:hypothetical protein
MIGSPPVVERRAYPRFRLAVRFSRWALSWLEEKTDNERRLSGFNLVLALFAVGFLNNWPAAWNGPAVAALAVIVFGKPVRDLFRMVPAGEALAALRVFFENVAGKAAAALPGAGFFSSSSASWAAGSVPMGGEVLDEDALQPPVAHGRPDEP